MLAAADASLGGLLRRSGQGLLCTECLVGLGTGDGPSVHWQDEGTPSCGELRGQGLGYLREGPPPDPPVFGIWGFLTAGTGQGG